MDKFIVTLFLALYYLRPQEWPLGLASIQFVRIAMLTGLATLFFRERGLTLRDFFRTPHDWAVLFFWLWIVFSSPTPWDTFKDSVNLYVFYIVIVQTLHTIPRIRNFLRWWTLLIIVVAALALASLYGFDPLDSLTVTMGKMKERLVLNLSIFNNPNALGHSVVPAIPMLYYVFAWKRPAVMKAIGLSLMGVAAYCIYLTVSKGAFIAGAATVLATFTFGRPKTVQALIVCAALVFGGSLLYALPRMQELQKSKTDDAIQGRVIAFKHGYLELTTTLRGVGFHGWQQSFLAAHYRYKPKHTDKAATSHAPPIIYKAPHSSYVGIGAELGYPGFFLFFGILYCCLRTLVTAKTESPEEESIRRVLFVLIVSYMVSSWMVDFAYRPTFFMFAAATAAFHRHLHGIRAEAEEREEEDGGGKFQPAQPAWRAALVPQPALAGALAKAGAPAAVFTLERMREPAHEPQPGPQSRIAFAWNRLGFADVMFTLAMTYIAIRYWVYVMQRM